MRTSIVNFRGFLARIMNLAVSTIVCGLHICKMGSLMPNGHPRRALDAAVCPSARKPCPRPMMNHVLARPGLSNLGSVPVHREGEGDEMSMRA